ncbi:hypothetical protein K438DRAFT_1865790 [Mycena galopus ATCC 62051]|nr:hypothetical protein K438DRAFT_1865790 [Mycena galopus ATCC 62051]
MLTHLAADRALVVDLDARILDLERSLFVLRTEKQLIQERLDSYKYPLLTLRTEIITQIFIRFLPIYPDCPRLTGLYSPTLLTQICREWREIALGTPTLWRAISLVSSPSIPFERKTHLLDTWLNRSRCCPLSIHFDEDSIDDELHASELLAAVVPHRTRWEYLNLNLSPSHIAIIQGPMPLLRHLDLTVGHVLNAIARFSPAPLLRSIILFATLPLNLAFPLQQITSLTLYRIYRFEYAVILQQTSNLVHCELGIASDWAASTDLPPEHGIELPCLESLSLKNEDAPETVGYLDDFLVPALRSLQLEEIFLGTEPTNNLASFISKSGCEPQQIHITNRILVSKASYRETFPSIPRFSFDEDSEAASIFAQSL